MGHTEIGVEFTFGDGHVRLSQQSYIDKLVASHLPEGVPKSTADKVPCDQTLPQHIADALPQDVDSIDRDLLQRYQSLVEERACCSST